MSLRDELPPKEHEKPIPPRYHDRAEIQAHIERFLASGGRIMEVPRGVSGNPDCIPLITNEFDPTKSTEARERIAKGKIGARRYAETVPVYLIPKTKKPREKSKCGQNIKKTKRGFSVIISATNYGNFAKNEEAIEKRDKVRESLGLPPASY